MFEFEFGMHMFETGLIAMCVCVYVLKIWSQKDELPKSQQFKHIA